MGEPKDKDRLLAENFLDSSALTVKLYPDPALKIPAAPVENFDDSLRVLTGKMRAVMDTFQGVGLAAPQVGISKRIAIVAHEDLFYVLINPRLVDQDGEQDGDEGCLSFPDIFVPVKRPMRVKVAAADESGREIVHEVDDFIARAFLHEMDHLDGTLLIDRVSPLKREMIRKKMKKRGRKGK
ncbi:MAG: peptide deformylase [Synergistaceae bacterium]|jgi:peptide deformylase|nr:peptide deformylase [Synergistaceae bacterium]